MKITLKEYAAKNGVTPSTVRHKIRRGTLRAEKIGRDWLIEENEPYIDKRIKSGKTVKKN